MELSDELTPSSNRRDGGILEIHRYMAVDTAKAAVPKTRKFDVNVGIETSGVTLNFVLGGLNILWGG